ncbi:SpoIID/LytB domain protein [Micrococcales bacterium KH10]|nr:SpoIID/LytB domain protein [Micrococcales bacterium KH10]
MAPKAKKKITLKLVVKKTSTTPGGKTRLRVVFKKNKKKVAAAKSRLQIKRAGKWQNTKIRVPIVNGVGKAVVTPKKTRKYRIKRGKHYSKVIKVLIKQTATTPKPLKAAQSFTVTGSGFGHGVGMSQYGAYQMARTGSTAAQILQHYYQGTEVKTATVPGKIAVQVFGPEPYGFSGYADSANTATFSISQGQWRIVDENGAVKFTTSGSNGKNAKAVLSVSSGKARAQISGGGYSTTVTSHALVLQWSGTPEFRPNDEAAVASLSGTHGKYRHGALVATAISGRLNVINDVGFTQYLYGIAEMPSSWGSPANGGSAALSAQAITARSYALVNMNISASNPNGKRKSACNCHIVDDVRDQHFTGWNKENEKVGSTSYGAIWRSAVDATVQGNSVQVLTYQNKPISTFYYSSSGGATANSEDVWVAEIPYLRSVPDEASLKAPGNSMTSWTRTIPAQRLAQMFGLPDVAKVKVVQRYSSGQAKKLRATASNGKKATFTAKADVIRARLGSLPSSWVLSIKPVL